MWFAYTFQDVTFYVSVEGFILATKQIHIFPQLGRTVPGEPSISYILFFHFKLSRKVLLLKFNLILT